MERSEQSRFHDRVPLCGGLERARSGGNLTHKRLTPERGSVSLARPRFSWNFAAPDGEESGLGRIFLHPAIQSGRGLDRSFHRGRPRVPLGANPCSMSDSRARSYRARLRRVKPSSPPAIFTSPAHSARARYRLDRSGTPTRQRNEWPPHGRGHHLPADRTAAPDT